MREEKRTDKARNGDIGTYQGYISANITNLLYIDDLKVYAASEAREGDGGSKKFDGRYWFTLE